MYLPFFSTSASRAETSQAAAEQRDEHIGLQQIEIERTRHAAPWRMSAPRFLRGFNLIDRIPEARILPNAS